MAKKIKTKSLDIDVPPEVSQAFRGDFVNLDDLDPQLFGSYKEEQLTSDLSTLPTTTEAVESKIEATKVGLLSDTIKDVVLSDFERSLTTLCDEGVILESIKDNFGITLDYCVGSLEGLEYYIKQNPDQEGEDFNEGISMLKTQIALTKRQAEITEDPTTKIWLHEAVKQSILSVMSEQEVIELAKAIPKLQLLDEKFQYAMNTLVDYTNMQTAKEFPEFYELSDKDISTSDVNIIGNLGVTIQ